MKQPYEVNSQLFLIVIALSLHVLGGRKQLELSFFYSDKNNWNDKQLCHHGNCDSWQGINDAFSVF